MTIKTILPLVVTFAICMGPSARAAEQPKPADADAPTSAEAKARAEYEAAEKAAKEAEAALGPLRTAMQEADKAYAEARKLANAKRKKATEAKNLAGEPGVKELERAEANLPAAVKALEEAKKAKPPLDKALAEAKAAAAPLQEAYDAAEKEAKAAEAAAKAAADAANKLDKDAERAAAQATAMQRAADTAKAALDRARQSQQRAQTQADDAAKKLAEAQAQKKSAEEALAKAKKKVADAQAALAAAEKAAQDAQAKAKQIAGSADKSDEEKKQAADAAAAKRKAADEAKAALAQARASQQDAQKQADAAAQNLAQAEGQKKLADSAVEGVKKQIAAAAKALAAAEKAAEAAAKEAEEKKQVAARAAAKRKTASDAAAALAQAKQHEEKAQAQAKAAAEKLAEAQAQKQSADEALAKARQQAGGDQAEQSKQKAQAEVEAAAKKLAEAEKQKKAADEALAGAKDKVAAAAAAHQAAREAAKELLELDEAAKRTAAEAAARRKVANEAKAALAPKAKALEQALVKANAAARDLDRAENRKKSAEETLANLKKRIAAAKKTHEADEKAAQEAEAAAAPLKEKAAKTREAYEAARKTANEKRVLAEQAKARLYRLVAARRVTDVMESSEPPKPANGIDKIIFARLKALDIEPVLCRDAVFIRRAYLDLTGTLPSAEEAKAFIQSSDKNKRVALIDRLLEQTEHVDYWAMKWSDILRVKAEYPVKVWPNAAQAYYRWIWESIAQNKPYDQFARELLTSSGSNFRVGAVNFYRAIQNNTPEGIAAAVGLALMGTRIHLWPEERREGMERFFSQVGYKPTSEWKEEIVFWDPLNSTAVPGSTAPGRDAVAKGVTATNQIAQALDEPLSPNGPIEAVLPDGTKTTIPPDRDPRQVFADWLIRPDNPWFAKAIANRTWAWAMGRGIIQEPDDIREGNPPSNPELLAYLEKELVSSGYDLKHLKRLIFTSTTYQFSSIPTSDAPEARDNFASYQLRRVEAEVLNDMLNQITGSSDLYTSAVPEPFTYIPDDLSAVALADGSISSSFLTLFGRSARATGMENERVNELASPQWLHMLNSATIQNKLQNGPKLKAIVSSGGKPEEIVEKLYLTILSRFPTEADVKAAEQHVKIGVTKGRDAWIDLAWALINSPEFLLRH